MVLALDLLLGVCFFLTVADGVRNGFFREGFTLAGVGVGLWAAIRFTARIQQSLPTWLKDEQPTGVVLFVLICVAVVLAMRLIGYAFSVMWEGKKPSPPSRIAGLVLGAVRGLLLVLVLAAGLTLLFPQGSRFLGRSRLLPYLSPGIVWGTELLPRELADRILWRWGQLPFGERGATPAPSSRGSSHDRSADSSCSGRLDSADAPSTWGKLDQWPFAS